ncbi:hypothetical protein N7541_008272 [Penicillium brevicompactum]|uniref:Uncharacterized protein n=1 Tax=Penicillium brevicompactum TaxID=5074 RepID=A0A9W9UPA6_PENBR|nr:hypothetical protein N7541_008272 [Penicillium brevicompactum]
MSPHNSRADLSKAPHTLHTTDLTLIQLKKQKIELTVELTQARKKFQTPGSFDASFGLQATLIERLSLERSESTRKISLKEHNDPHTPWEYKEAAKNLLKQMEAERQSISICEERVNSLALQSDGGGPEAAVAPASEAMLPAFLEQLERPMPSMDCDRLDNEMMQLGILAGCEDPRIEVLHDLIQPDRFHWDGFIVESLHPEYDGTDPTFATSLTDPRAGHFKYRHVEELHIFVRNKSKLPPFALDIGLKQIYRRHPYVRYVDDSEPGEQAHEFEEQRQNREPVYICWKAGPY